MAAKKDSTKSRFKLSLANQVLAGYSVIILVATIISIICIFSLRSNQSIDRQISKVNLPFYLNLKDLNNLSGELMKLTNAWIYQPNPEDKKKLLSLINTNYPKLAENTNLIIEDSKDKAMDSVKSALTSLKDLTADELNVTQILKADSLYSNDVLVDQAIQLMDKSISPKTIQLQKLLQAMILNQEQKIADAQIQKESSYTTLMFLLLLMMVAFILTTLAAYSNVKRRIVTPIVAIKDSLIELGKGKIALLNQNSRADEVGQMHNAMANLIKGINAKSLFASQIGNGKYEEQFELLSADDSMGQALLTMRDNLKKNAEEDNKRNWAVTGLAKFGELLRNQDQNLKAFGDQVLAFTVKYSKANQGRLYIVNNGTEGNEYLELIATYAWGKKKFINEKIEMGQGLTGQCWQEQDPIYLTEVPENYIKITSGLGATNPRNIFIVPLKVNDKIYGVLELASLHLFQEFEREFITKLSESLAAAISAVIINDNTKTLLTQTQQQAEEMRSQEEEMRQNMEELSATQEEMARKEREYIDKIARLEKELAVK